MDTGKLVLSAADYAIIVAMLAVSSSIGLYFRFVGGKQKTEDEFLLAGKDMPIFPVAFSMMATFMSAHTLMGIPVEMYLYGTHLVFMNVGFVTGTIAISYFFLPMYFSGKVSTIYQYLEGRYGKLARSVCSFAYILQTVLFISVVLYAPSIALSAVTNVSTMTSVITIGSICTFYCTLGGMKAVLWTDVFQTILMFLGIIAVIVSGCSELGGISGIFKTAKEGERLVIPSFELDFKTRYTMWSVLLQGFIITAFTMGCTQSQVQRLLTVKSINRARIAAFLSLPMIVSFHVLTCLCGLVIYAKFHNCDPVTSPAGPIQSSDQLFPYYIMTTMSNLPGLPGLCICCIFSASLSTVSSDINSLAAVTLEDFVKPLCKNKAQIRSNIWAPVITLAYGVLCIALTFAVDAVGSIMTATFAIFGIIGGPILGIFVLAAFTTTANEKGSIIGLVCSIILGGWITFCVQIKSYPTLPLSTDGCSNVFNETFSFDQMNGTSHDVFTDIKSENGTLSVMWTTTIGFLSTLFTGFIASLLIRCFTDKNSAVSPEFLCPARRWFCSKNLWSN